MNTALRLLSDKSVCFHFIQLPLCLCWKLQEYFWCFVKLLPPGLTKVQHNLIDWTLQPGCKIELVCVRTWVKTPHSRNTRPYRVWTLWVTANRKRLAVVWVLLALIFPSFFFFYFIFFWNAVGLHFSAASRPPVQCSTARIKCAAL